MACPKISDIVVNVAIMANVAFKLMINMLVATQIDGFLMKKPAPQ